MNQKDKGDFFVGDFFFMAMARLLQLFRVSHEKGDKYLAILHETTSDRYFIVKCFPKSIVVRLVLLSK